MGLPPEAVIGSPTSGAGLLEQPTYAVPVISPSGPAGGLLVQGSATLRPGATLTYAQSTLSASAEQPSGSRSRAGTQTATQAAEIQRRLEELRSMAEAQRADKDAWNKTRAREQADLEAARKEGAKERAELEKNKVCHTRQHLISTHTVIPVHI